jgi:hypothetical protein
MGQDRIQCLSYTEDDNKRVDECMLCVARPGAMMAFEERVILDVEAFCRASLYGSWASV